jgi:hypothetical protein
LQKALDSKNFKSKTSWFLADHIQHREFVAHQAVLKMVASKLSKIGIIWSTQGPTTCLLGSWLAEKWIGESIGKDKLAVKQVDGNHFLHYYRPKEFWEVVLELSV